MHKTLQRQLTQLFGSPDNTPLEYKELIDVVNKTYKNFQSEYELIERSLDISSAELTELNEQLRQETKIIEKQVELRTKELSIERSKLEIIAQNMPTGAILIDNLGEVLFLNKQARLFINHTDDSYKGALEKLYATYADYPIAEYIRRSLQKEELKIDEVQTNEHFFSIKFKPLINDFISSGIMIWIDNITEEKILERAKSELLVVASHQLRTPLTVTKGNTEILLDESYGALNEEQKIILNQTHESNENMITLVNQMLDTNKIEQGKFGFEFVEVNIEEILERALKDLSIHAAEHKVETKYHPTNKEIPLIKGDETRLYQVFQNLIDNAIKYSRPQLENCIVDVAIDVIDDYIVITIKDSGIGIPKQEQDKIFSRFYRASNVHTHFINGTGLGLHIVKTIVESMDGQISFDSVENQGTIFTIKFPVV